MRSKIVFAIIGCALMFSAGGALAQDDDPDATMSLMEHLDDKLADAVINDIVIPAHLMSGEGEDPTAAETNSMKGIENANSSRDKRLEGLETADDASAHGFEMRESAEESRENMGRSEEHRPEPPTPPGPPGGG